MKELMISSFIDNELNINEKIDFVKEVKQDDEFYEDTLDFLYQEQKLSNKIKPPTRELNVKSKRKIFTFPIVTSISAAALLLLSLTIYFGKVDNGVVLHSQRFVIYMPEAEKVEVAGTFTNWNRIKMHKLQNTGYWDIEVDITEGEHRYSFIVDETKEISDPTVAQRENNDFGGQNSIIKISG